MTALSNISGEYVKKCCLAQLNGIRKRKCSVIREDASQFLGFQARAGSSTNLSYSLDPWSSFQTMYKLQDKLREMFIC
jgi:hypothetical protein